MVVKYKRKRRAFIKILCVLVFLFIVFTVIEALQSNDIMMALLSIVFQFILWFGLYYYQIARYTDDKIMAQFGWPSIHYDQIVSIERKWGDIVIKSEKEQINIKSDLANQESLIAFLKHLDSKTSQKYTRAIISN